ncbi:MAG: HAD family phosphatase [Chloroflexota bacterium]
MTAAQLAPPRAVVLDLDGTLVDTVQTRIDAWVRTFAEEGIPADQALVSALIGSDGRQLATQVGEAAGTHIDDERAERIDARSGAIYSELNASPRLLPGVTPFLDALDAAVIPWAIGTSSRREQVGPSVAALRRTSPPRIVDGTAVKLAKPHPDLLLAAARVLDTDPAACWCVGDSTWDMLAAAAAGMPAVGITAGSAVTAEQLQEAGASLVLPTVAELIPYLSSG